jgi:hypothetical protein
MSIEPKYFPAEISSWTFEMNGIKFDLGKGANKEHIQILEKGSVIWNKWRLENPLIVPNLEQLNLSGNNLSGFNFSNANLYSTDFLETNLSRSDLSGSMLESAQLSYSNCENANFQNSNLFKAVLMECNMKSSNFRNCLMQRTDISGSDFSFSNLSGVDFGFSIIIGVNFFKADLSGCRIYGTSIWDINIEDTKQDEIIISPYSEPMVTVESLRIGQFVNMMLEHGEIREMIDSIATKAVLILGRFTPKRKKILDFIRAELKKRNYLPIIFDTQPSDHRDLTETITTLAHMSRFIIVDISDPKSVPQELQAIIPGLPSVPVQPIIESGKKVYELFDHFTRYPWVLDLVHYKNLSNLKNILDTKILQKAEQMSSIK